MVVLSPAFTALTALLALAGSSSVEAHPVGSNIQGLQQRKYLQPHEAAPAHRFNAAQPVWNRNTDNAGTGENRFTARANKYRSHKYSNQKRSEFVRTSNCKRDDSAGPNSIPGFVLVATEDERHDSSRRVPKKLRKGTGKSLGSIKVHATYNTTATETNSTSKADLEYEELNRLQLLGVTPTNFTLKASKEERSLLYIIPADAQQQRNLGEIMRVNATNSNISDIVLDTVTVHLVAPLMNDTATARNWCATFATAALAPLHLQPCTYAPGYVGEKTSQRFQFSPRTGSLLPLFVQEQPGSVIGSWHKPEKNITSTGRQQKQLEDGEVDSDKSQTEEDLSIVASTRWNSTSFAVSSVEHSVLNLTFVPASTQPPLPNVGCDSLPSSSSGVPVPVSTSKSSRTRKPTTTQTSSDRTVPTSSGIPTSSSAHHHHSKSSASSSIGSLKPSRHSHYTSPAATSTNVASVATDSASASAAITSSVSHDRPHHSRSTTAIADPTVSSAAVSTSSAMPTSSHSKHHHHESSASESSSSHNTIVAPVESAPVSSASTSSAAPVETSSAEPTSKPIEPSSILESTTTTQPAEPTTTGWDSTSSWAPVVTSSAEPSSNPIEPSSISVSPTTSLPAEPTAEPTESSTLPSSSVPSGSASGPAVTSTPGEDSSDDSNAGTLWAVPV